MDKWKAIATDIIAPSTFKAPSESSILKAVNEWEKNMLYANAIDKIVVHHPTIEMVNKVDKNAHIIHRQVALQSIKKVIYNDPATIVYWNDGTKTVVKCDEKYDEYNPELGLAMAIVKKHYGNAGYYYDVFKKWLPEDYDGSKKTDKKAKKNKK